MFEFSCYLFALARGSSTTGEVGNERISNNKRTGMVDALEEAAADSITLMGAVSGVRVMSQKERSRYVTIGMMSGAGECMRAAEKEPRIVHRAKDMHPQQISAIYTTPQKSAL